MSEDLDDIINTLLEQIWDIKQGHDRDACQIYLRSTCQKLLFAEKRIESLNSEVERYIQTLRNKQIASTLNIEMEFDHCVLSLRSCLEHLAQLINAIIPLNLAPRITKGKKPVTLSNVIDELPRNKLSKNSECLLKLSSYLRNEVEKPGYQVLHDLRITMFHDRFNYLPRTSLHRMNRELLELEFLLPDDMARSLVEEREKSITSYCESVIGTVEGVLKESFKALSKYLADYRLEHTS